MIQLIKTSIYIYIYIEWGYQDHLERQSRNHLAVLLHCKVSCDSPCCTKIRGEDNHCVFNIGTHENVNNDSDEDTTNITHTNDTPK